MGTRREHHAVAMTAKELKSRDEERAGGRVRHRVLGSGLRRSEVCP